MSVGGSSVSLTDEDRRVLTIRLYEGVSVREAARERGVDYRHALHFAHSLGFRFRRAPSPKAVARAVSLVASGSTLREAARHCGVSESTVSRAAVTAGVYTPRRLPRGAAATSRRVDYLQHRCGGMSRREAATVCGISVSTARNYELGLVSSSYAGKVWFVPQGPDVMVYNQLMTAVLPADAITPDMTAPAMDTPPVALSDTAVDTPADAAAAASGSPAGGVAVVDPYQAISPRYLSLQDRERIFDLYKAGHSIRGIARALGRAPSTISRELRRNPTVEGAYGPLAAQRAAAARRKRPKQPIIMADDELRALMKEKLKQRWSPEEIAGWLRVKYPEKKRWHVCHETIYQALYLQARGGLKHEIEQALRHGRAMRKPRTTPGMRTKRFVDDMVMISDRPAEVDDRAIPGHWEGDLILGAQNKSAIGTLVERTTRYVMLVHLPGSHDAESVLAGLKETIGTLPKQLKSSLTWDQGSEMAAHQRFTIATGCPVYFCDPASPWQRGTNENTNGLLRQYFPKGTDLSVHPKEELERVAKELNERPRKTLGFLTPAEKFHALIDAS